MWVIPPFWKLPLLLKKKLLFSGWVEPLLDRIGRDSTTVVCPVIEVVSDENFQFTQTDASAVYVGGFEWGLTVRIIRNLMHPKYSSPSICKQFLSYKQPDV